MSRSGAAAVAVAAIIAVALPFFLKPFGIYLLSMWAVLTIAAMGLNLTLGYAGQVSLAQGAFVGIGAYAAALLTKAGCPFALAFVAAGALSFAVGWVLGYPALRVQHHYLAFVTLAFTTLVFLVLRNEEWLTNGIYGIDDIARPAFFGWSTGRPLDFYFFALGTLAVLAFATWLMLRSPWGRAFVALRENPVRAQSLGLDTRRYTLMAFAIGSCLGGLSGALYAPLVQFIEPPAFALALSFNLLLMVIAGGSGHFFGPFAGALVAVLLPEWLRVVEGYYLILYAALVMALMAFRPSGIMGLVESISTTVVGWAKAAPCPNMAPTLTRRAHHSARGGHGGSTPNQEGDASAAFAHPTMPGTPPEAAP
jgi:branched-chain amino acid transport system permease protein